MTVFTLSSSLSPISSSNNYVSSLSCIIFKQTRIRLGYISIYKTHLTSAATPTKAQTITQCTMTITLSHSSTQCTSPLTGLLATGVAEAERSLDFKSQGTFKGPFVNKIISKHQFWSKSRKERNSDIRAYNGNTIKILNLNKSSSNILTKHVLIKSF